MSRESLSLLSFPREPVLPTLLASALSLWSTGSEHSSSAAIRDTPATSHVF